MPCMRTVRFDTQNKAAKTQEEIGKTHMKTDDFGQVQLYLELCSALRGSAKGKRTFREWWELFSNMPLHYSRVMILRAWMYQSWSEIGERVYPTLAKDVGIRRAKWAFAQARKQLIKYLEEEVDE